MQMNFEKKVMPESGAMNEEQGALKRPARKKRDAERGRQGCPHVSAKRENTFRCCRLGRFFIFAAIVLFSIVTFCQTGTAQVSNSYDREPVSPGISPAGESGKTLPKDDGSERGSSTLWRSYLWESLPTDNSKGPEPDPVSEAYQSNDWKPFFISSRFKLNQGGEHLLSRLRKLESDAIDPRPFRLDELSQIVEELDRHRSALWAADPEVNDSRGESVLGAQQPAASANNSTATAPPLKANSEALAGIYRETFRAASETDIRLTAAFFLFTREMNPYLQKEDTLNALLGEVPVLEFLKELEPKTFNYEALRSAYAKYRNLAAQGAQQRVTMPSKASRGESGNHIRDLQKRLQQEGFYPGTITGVYDAETQRAVKEFQTANLLDPDGAVGQRTKDSLNVSFQERADLVAYALRAVRHSPSRSGNRFIRINIPQFLLEYYKDGQLQEAHRIVVGKASGKKVKFRGKMVGENQTPTLASSIGQVILNPRWYVSDRIRLELETEARSDPEWFAKHGYVNMTSRYPWGAPRLFQSPGPKNALGRVKFEFSNPYAVYLHDTPLKQLFARSRRDFSHGCIRVDKAVELAETILRDDSSPYAKKMESILEGSRQVFVKLSNPVLICLEYIPVVVSSSGQLIFAGDPYGILKEDEQSERMKI
jgi:murein L,D-transpeptidase YcbB/YkuD